MFDKDNKFGFINNNSNNSSNIKDTDLPHTISSKVLGTVPASDIIGNIPASDERLRPLMSIANASINKDRRYYIEFLGSKKLCSLLISETNGNSIMCSIGNYSIQTFNDSPDIIIDITKINEDDTTTTTFTDLIIYEEEIKCLDNKYLETDLTLQNSISLGRKGDIGTGSSAIGIDVIASGNYGAHAEGSYTIASGNGSHAEGSSTIASGDSSHAEGDSTIASGEYGSHAEGDGGTASGKGSHAEGCYTTSSGEYSHAEGSYTTASSNYQHVQGQCNIEDTEGKYAHIVGNGTASNKRSNAHTLDWKGNGWYSGKLSQEGIPTENKDLTTKKYVDDKVSNLPQFSFNASGELVVTINGVTKTFVPKE